jgi:hypothetical protein
MPKGATFMVDTTIRNEKGKMRFSSDRTAGLFEIPDCSQRPQQRRCHSGLIYSAHLQKLRLL